MTIFQVVLLSVAAIMLLGMLVSLVRGWATPRESVLWLLVIVAGAVAVIWPELTTRVAREVGIRRGADFVLYCAVVFTTAGLAMLYIRLRHVRREVTLLVRHLAILEAEEASS